MSTPLRQPSSPATAAPQDRTFFKWGAYERVYRRDSDAEGRRWHRDTKAIAAALMVHAFASRGYVCSLDAEERERFGTVAKAIQYHLDMDDKTFRKRLQPLVDAGLVLVDRNRPGAAVQYVARPLFEYFGEARPADRGSKVASLQNRNASGSAQNRNSSGSGISGSEPDALPGASEDFPFRTTKNDASEPEDFPVSTRTPSVSSSSSPPHHLDPEAAAARLGLTTMAGIADDLLSVAIILDEWGVTLKQQRTLIKTNGVTRIADAAGYVHEQSRLYPGTVRNPVGLLFHALKEGKCGTLPARQNRNASGSSMDCIQAKKTSDLDQNRNTSGSDADPAQNGKASDSEQSRNASGSTRDEIFEAVCAQLRTRVSGADYGVFVKNASLVSFDGDSLTVGFPNSFVRQLADQRVKDKYASVLQSLTGRSDITLTFISLSETENGG